MRHTVETLTQLLNQYPKDTPVLLEVYTGAYLIEQTKATLQPIAEIKYSDSGEPDLEVQKIHSTKDTIAHMVVIAEDD